MLWPGLVRTVLCGWFSTGISNSPTGPPRNSCTSQPRKFLSTFSPRSFLCPLQIILSFPSTFNSILRWKTQTYIHGTSKQKILLETTQMRHKWEQDSCIGGKCLGHSQVLPRGVRPLKESHREGSFDRYGQRKYVCPFSEPHSSFPCLCSSP